MANTGEGTDIPDTLLIKNARHIITCDDSDLMYESAGIYIEDGVIRYIGKDAPGCADLIDASEMAVYPGLVNTHHHLYQILTRNLPQVQHLELFDWLRALYSLWARLDADSLYAAVSAGLGELLLSGCTTCFDHHYVFPRGCGDLLEAEFEAASRLGIRMTASRGSMSRGESSGGLPPDSVVQTVDEILADSRDAISRFHDPSPYSMRQVVLAPCSPFSVTDDLMRESAALAREYKVRLHTHLAETKDEEAFVLEKYGMRPLAYMESLGWLGPDVWFAHGVHFSESELHQMGKAGVGVAHCPAANMKLSSGVARVPEMLELGVPVGLGVDGSASNDASSLPEQIRLGYLLHRLSSGDRAPSGYDMLKLATRGGARLLGRSDIGMIAPGMAADLFLVDETRIELSGATFDPKSMLATVGLSGRTDYTIVNGRVVVREGRLTGADEAELNRAVYAEVLRLQ